jgi:hypothetical protein
VVSTTAVDTTSATDATVASAERNFVVTCTPPNTSPVATCHFKTASGEQRHGAPDHR